MTDYKEEQSNEIEVLDSIYPTEFEILDTEPYFKFKIFIKSDDYNEDDEVIEGAALELIIGYTKTYPDAPPTVDVSPMHNLEDDDADDLKTQLIEQCSENLGTVMVFTLVSFSVEWLNNKVEEEKRLLEEVLLKKKKEIEEIDRKKIEGTRVTVESFLAWKTLFDSNRVSYVDKEKENAKNKKLTGKELFLNDTTLNVSDLTFLGEADEVAVDESLFQDLEDLSLGDEDDESDDEDYVPGQDD